MRQMRNFSGGCQVQSHQDPSQFFVSSFETIQVRLDEAWDNKTDLADPISIQVKNKDKLLVEGWPT